MSNYELYQELYECSFKRESEKITDECFLEITLNMKLFCTEDEITKLSLTYTSLGELFETKLDDNGYENFFNYLDSVYTTDTKLFTNLHIKFIKDVLNEIRENQNSNLTHLMKIGCMALLGNKLKTISINKKFPSPFSKAFLISMIEEQELISAKNNF